MAPLKPIKKDAADKRIQQLLDCAKKVANLLSDRAPIPITLEAELEGIITRSFPLPSSTAHAGKSSALDTLGSQLWNAATNILREEENQREGGETGNGRPRTVVVLRTLAFLLVDAAHHISSRHTRDPEQRVRTFKLANKACHFCLDREEPGLALKILERSAEFVSDAEDETLIVQIAEPPDDAHGGYRQTVNSLVADYYLLRITHAWKTDRFDVADHFHTKLDAKELAASVTLAEQAADMYHEAGKASFARTQLGPTIKWCERALSALDACSVEDTSYDALELRLAVAGTLVEALLAQKTADDIDRASSVVNQLDSNHGLGNRIVVPLMRIQILTANEKVDVDQLAALLRHMMRLAVMTDKTFKAIMQTIHKARRYSTCCALITLGEFITLRLVPDLSPNEEPESAARDRLERATVTYVLFATTETETSPAEAIAGLRDLFDSLVQRNNGSLSAKATHAAQTLLWKTAGVADVTVADDWCKLLRHSVFNSAGQLNKAKIARKTMVTALARDDFNAAREAFFEMPQSTQNEGITRYLTFKLALRSSDHELATESLAIIAKSADKDPTFLYACVLEAQQSNFRHLAVTALQALLDKQPLGVHLPSLLRCTARLLIGELSAQERSTGEAVEEVVLLFERAGTNIKAFRQGSDEQWRAEIQWWSKNAYNLALRLCTDIHPDLLVRLLAVCSRFLEFYPDDGGLVHRDDVSRRKSLCHFLSATALIVLARSGEEGSESTLQCYLRARKEIATFMALAKTQETGPQPDVSSLSNPTETSTRTFELLKFDLECILQLQQWDQLTPNVQAFLNFQQADRWDSLADLALIVHDRVATAVGTTKAATRIPELLQKCINETWKRDKDITRMSRWLRLTFSLHLHDEENGLALKIVQQAAGIAQKGYDGHADPYPGDELQWLATMAFNRAVDALAEGEQETADVWIEAALELARYADDHGSLHANLTSKRRQAEARMLRRRQML